VTYERIIYRDRCTGPLRTVFIEAPRPVQTMGVDALAGRRVNRDGEPVADLFIVTTAEVIYRRPYVMDLHYGWLVHEGNESARSRALRATVN
jgi:hypothetical protein